MTHQIQREKTLIEKRLAGDFRNALITKELKNFHVVALPLKPLCHLLMSVV